MHTRHHSLRLSAWLLIICYWLCACGASAGTFSAQWLFRDSISNVLAVKEVWLDPIAAYGVDGTTIVISGDRITKRSDAAGSLIVNNLFNARSYRVTLSGPWIHTVFTNTFGTNIAQGALVNGADPQYLVAPIRDGTTYAYSQAAADLRFVARSTGYGTNLHSRNALYVDTAKLTDNGAGKLIAESGFSGNGASLFALPGGGITLGTINSNKLDAATLALLGTGGGGGGGDTVWTNVGGVIQPVGAGANTNQIQISPLGNISLGSFGVDYLPSPNPNYSLLNWKCFSLDGIDENEMLFGVSTDTTAAISAQWSFDTYVGAGSEYCELRGVLNLDAGINLFAYYVDADTLRQQLSYHGSVVSTLEPTAADGSTPYLFDTSVAHTSGNLLELKNAGDLAFSVDYAGNVTVPGDVTGAALSVGVVQGGYTNQSAAWDAEGFLVGVDGGGGGGDTIWTNVDGVIQPTGVNVFIGSKGGIYSGHSVVEDTGTLDGLGILTESFADTDDPNNSSFYFQRADSLDYNWYTYIEASVRGSSPENLSASFNIADGNGNGSIFQLLAGDFAWHVTAGNTTILSFVPTAGEASTPYIFDTSVAHTSSNLLDVKTAGETKFAIAWDGALTLEKTNAAPAGFTVGTTEPVVWFSVTNGGTPYLIPGYAP